MSDTLFKEVRYDLNSLINFIDLGEIGLPDIQRPFVWKNSKIRDLFDSMYQGFPVGYLLFWQNAVDGSRTIGAENKQKVPRLLVVDGQQRLTSLYAVLKSKPIVRETYETEKIQIAFNPLLEKFEVADAAVRNDKSFLQDISALWGTKADLFDVVDSYLERLEGARDLSETERKQIKKAITKLHSLPTFPFTALELSVDMNEEQVAEVFVRINSAGKHLNQADFILTLMSVFWDEGRTRLEEFCRDARSRSDKRPSPQNQFIEPTPDQLLRADVGVAFRRARLRSVYSILRGKDVETDDFSEERRDQQFAQLRDAQGRVLNLQYWHDFFKAILKAGYRSDRMISSQNTLLFTYIFYLLGRTEFGVPESELRRVLARWFFMASITGRYTGSPESTMEFDLARFRSANTAEDFVVILDKVCDDSLTADFWEITLPNDLATSSPRSPSLFAYYASLNILDALVLFSDRKVHELLDPAMDANRSAIERHHLFPKKHLEDSGITGTRHTNQIANYALVEWGDNSDISDRSPAEYFPEYRAKVPAKSWERMTYWHALPDNWEHMDYDAFLESRRELIAGVIRDAFDELSKAASVGKEEDISVEALIEAGEGDAVEFKSTLRVNLHTNKPDERMELSCLKTIAGFLNSAKGGTLVIGVADDGSPVGVSADGFPNEDEMDLHLSNLINARIGSQFMMYIHPTFLDYDGDRVMSVECRPAKSPVFVKDGSQERFFIRSGASSRELQGAPMKQYISERFK